MSRWYECDVSSPGGAASNGPPGRLTLRQRGRPTQGRRWMAQQNT
jgi:hypothetical protein